jgi:hypothetical protein
MSLGAGCHSVRVFGPADRVQEVEGDWLILYRESGSSTTNPEGLTYTKVSPTRYRVEVTNSTGPFLLVFSDTFHRDWRATIDGQRLPEENHILVNGYANGWWIERQGSYEVEIVFTPQALLRVGRLVSVVAAATAMVGTGLRGLGLAPIWRRKG